MAYVIKLDYLVDPLEAYMIVSGYGALLFESGMRVADTGDSSIILYNPREIVYSISGSTIIRKNGKEEKLDTPLLELLDQLSGSRKPLGTGLIFDGGFAGYLSYDFGIEMLGVKSKNKPAYNIPGAFFGYYEDFIIIDHKLGCTYIHTCDTDIVEKIRCSKGNAYVPENMKAACLMSNLSRQEYMAAVNMVREYIRQGDVYQVNISQQFSGYGRLNPLEVYSRLRKANYGPYNAFLDVGDSCILSTSPEQFIRVRNGNICTRPIKGTIRRSSNMEENEKLKEELLNSGKDRSELLMIIDLERNDLSKVSVPGTVRVEKLYEVEEYATVNHLVSTVTARLKENVRFSDIIKATFPGGSITGAPKLRAIEIIDELENVSRGIYTGSIGYLSNNGNMDFNIVIRTAVINAEGVFYNVGGGIVWDSDPDSEYEETLHKGRALYKSLAGEENKYGN